jgi:hypothetical protein
MIITTTIPTAAYTKVEFEVDEGAIVTVVELGIEVEVNGTVADREVEELLDADVVKEDADVELTIEAFVELIVELETNVEELVVVEFTGAASYKLSSQNTGLVSA